MKKAIMVGSVLLCVGLVGGIGFKIWSTNLVKEAMALEDVSIDMSKLKDGVYEGHSELGPVIVNVKVTVEKGKIIGVEILEHQNGLGQAANVIVEDMVEQNTYDVDAVTGATVSSEVIMNAVNNALQKGIR